MRTCPLGHTCNACIWWTRIRGMNTLTGKDEDIENCAINIVNELLVKNIQNTNSVGAAVESFRNEMVNQQGTFLGLMNEVVDRPKLLE